MKVLNCYIKQVDVLLQTIVDIKKMHIKKTIKKCYYKLINS